MLLLWAPSLSPQQIPVSYTVIYHKWVPSDKKIEHTHDWETVLNHNSPCAHVVYTFVILFVKFSIITLPKQAGLIKENSSTSSRRGRKCWPFWHVVINYSNWGLQSTEFTSHIHRETHFSAQRSWKFSCAENIRSTRFVYIHQSLLGKYEPTWHLSELYGLKKISTRWSVLRRMVPKLRRRIEKALQGWAKETGFPMWPSLVSGTI